jgi:hypothetical protein
LAGEVEVGGDAVRERIGAVKGAVGDPKQYRQGCQADGFERLAHGVLSVRECIETIQVDATR